MNRIYENLDKGLNPISVFMDLSKAFDTLNHEILLKKLEKYGISNTELNWFQSYLYDRFQCVTYNDKSSRFLKITTGVPQGSILGPLLFLIYINDLPSVTNLNIIQYADDTCFLIPYSYTTIDEDVLAQTRMINNELHTIHSWLKANKLSLNIGKTKCMIFHFKQKKILINPNIKIDNKELSFVDQYKFLGLKIDNCLSWNDHINYIANKMSKINGILSKTKHFLPKHILLMMYNSLILPLINYGINLWGFGNLERLETVQKKAIRNINKQSPFTHTIPICKQLNILYLKDIFDLENLKFFYKYQHEQLPKYFTKNQFIKTYETCRPNLRVTNPKIFENYITHKVNYCPKFYIPLQKRTLSKNRISIRIPTLMNINYFPNCIADKIYTHSLSALSIYFKNYTIASYDPVCHTDNCYICRKY